MFIVGIHPFFSKLVVYKIPRIRMKLKASVLGRVTRAVLGAGRGAGLSYSLVERLVLIYSFRQHIRAVGWKWVFLVVQPQL